MSIAVPFRRRTATPLALALVLLGGGCAVGPNFVAPAAPTVDRLTAEPLPAQTASAAIEGGESQRFVDNGVLPLAWWTLFGSEKLDALVDQALRNSPTLTSAQATLRQAQENLRAQRSGLFPSLDGKASATRQKIDTASFGAPGGGTQLYNLYNVSADVSYTLDLFGGVRRGIESQAALVEYQHFQLEGAYQTLVANVVTSAVEEARLRKLAQGQVQIVGDLERQLKIVNARFDAGAVARADVLSAQSSLATERGTLISYQLQMSKAQNLLAVYLGQLPSERASGDFDIADLKLPTEIPVSMPSALLRQRPDVRAAEAQLHSASAQVGVATANLFPQLTISGSFGTQASQTNDLFKSDIWSIAGNLTQPIFHAGELTAKRRAAIAAYDQSAADYRQTVLQAFRNVADSLQQVDANAATLQTQLDASSAAERSFRLTETQYKLGAVGYPALLTIEQQYLVAYAGLVNAQAARFSDTAALFQALGGGWWNRAADAPMPQATASSQPIFP